MRQRRKIVLGNQQPAFKITPRRETGLDESAVKRGYQLKQTTIHLLQSVAGKHIKAGKMTIRPGILAAAVIGIVFLFLSFISGGTESAGDIRSRIPKLREQYVSYQLTQPGNDRALASQRWQSIERLLQEIAHYKQSGEQEQVRRKLGELLILEPDEQNPIHQFCFDLRKQMPAE